MKIFTVIAMLFTKFVDFVVSMFLSPDDLIRGAIEKIRKHEDALRNNLANIMVQIKTTSQQLEKMAANKAEFEKMIKKHLENKDEFEAKRIAIQIQSVNSNTETLKRTLKTLKDAEVRVNDEILNCSTQIQTLENRRTEIQSSEMLMTATGSRMKKSDYRKLIDEANRRIDTEIARDEVDQKFDDLDNVAERAATSSSIDDIMNQYRPAEKAE